MLNNEKYYKCVHCGKKFPFEEVWFCDNKTKTGICYNKDCIQKEDEKLKHQLEYTPTNLTWEQLTS